MIDHQVLARGSVLREIELIFQQSASSQSDAGLPQENFVVPKRATIPCPRRQSRPRQRCGSLSLTRGFYRCVQVMQSNKERPVEQAVATVRIHCALTRGDSASNL